jgi:hypothetical protein
MRLIQKSKAPHHFARRDLIKAVFSSGMNTGKSACDESSATNQDRSIHPEAI